MRGEPRQFTYSKVMVWVAFDRAIKSAEQFGLEGPVDHWRALRGRDPRAKCVARALTPEIGAFVQSYGSHELDASLCCCPWSDSCRRAIRGFAAPSRRSSAT